MALCGLLAVVCLVASLLLLRNHHPAGRWCAIAAVLMFAASVSLYRNVEQEEDLSHTEVPVRVPEQVTGNGFVSSATCSECHTAEHTSWHQSYHRTMTQVVTPQTMAAPREEVHLKMHGREFRFIPQADHFVVETADPEWDERRRKVGLMTYGENEKPPYVRRQIVLSSGSHHYQTYWINGNQGNQLWRLPWVYHILMRRWVPVQDTFIVPPLNHRDGATWNDNCIHCHAVGGEPGIEDPQKLQTRVGEFGIACEACHGPGQEHVAYRRQLLDTGEQGEVPDPTIVNPLRLSHERSAEVCGQCHASTTFVLDNRKLFNPGEPLEDAVVLNRFTDGAVQNTQTLKDSFWRDGTMRVAGRDFSALEVSACFQQGKATCTSCHSMHSYESPDDQLLPGMHSDAACLQCHESFSRDVSAHTHHAPQSSGSRCTNCHMTHVTFGLFKAIRSHRIDSPTTAMTLNHGRPNACVLCHTDRTLPWSDDRLADWYGHEKSKTGIYGGPFGPSPAVTFLLSGDAVQRAVMAWNFGRKESHKAAGSDWQLPLLAELLDDPYAVVRAVAGDAIRKFPGMDEFQYDYLSTRDERQKARADLIQQWEKRRSAPGQGNSLANRSEAELQPVLLRSGGKRDLERLQELLKFRDDREIILAE